MFTQTCDLKGIFAVRLEELRKQDS